MQNPFPFNPLLPWCRILTLFSRVGNHLADDDTVQGRISLRIDGGVADVAIVETAPHSYGLTGKYQGVGGHLFAIAC